MYLPLILLFVSVPLLEIALLIKVGGLIGFWLTMLIVIGTAIVGTALMHRQGLQALMKAQSTMNEGKIPVEPVIDGAFLLLSGAFLLTPGLITDAIGFLFLIPPLRRWLARWGFRKIMKSGRVHGSVFGGPGGSGGSGPGRPDPPPRQSGDGTKPPPEGGTVIEGEFERLDETTIKPGRRR